MMLAGQRHACWKCQRRLPIDNLEGSVVVLCPKCHSPNNIVLGAMRFTSREQMSS